MEPVTPPPRKSLSQWGQTFTAFWERTNINKVIVIATAFILLACCGSLATNGGKSTTASIASSGTPRATNTPRPTNAPKDTSTPKPTIAPTFTATPAPTWVTVQTFSGESPNDTANPKTADFTISGSWRVNWTCKRLASSDGSCQMRLQSTDGTYEDVVANTIGNNSGTYQGPKDGSFHFQISVFKEGWNIEVQELK